jgi:hypothetical protein
MKLGFVCEQERRIVWRRLAAPGLVLVTAVLALAAVVHLVQAQAGSSVATSAAMLPPPHPATIEQAVIAAEGFEGAQVLNFWQLTGKTNGPRWNLMAQGSTYANVHGGSKAMWFGDPATGQYGGPGCIGCPVTVHSGTLTYVGPPIALPTNVSLTLLSFWSWEYTEMSVLPGGFQSEVCYGKPTCPFDVRRVWISGTADAVWRPVWDTRFNGTQELAWHQVTIDISQYKGQGIRMRFDFNTDPSGQDQFNNDGRGWYVDDVSVSGVNLTRKVYLPIMRKQS